MERKTQPPSILARVDHPEGRASARVLRGLASEFLAALGLSGAQLSLVVTSDARIRRLNRQWRGKDQSTDVLSFPAAPHPGLAPRARCLGDVVISLDTARRRAREDRRPLRRELARYLAHGLLHLLGHDHHRPVEARRMARAEQRLLGAAGMLFDSEELGDRPGGQKTRPTPDVKKKSVK